MNDDIVNRLRAVDYNSVDECLLKVGLFIKAADEIERLRRELNEARAAITIQARAAKTLQACEDREIALLRKDHHDARVAAKTLDSERAVNAALTDEIEHLRAREARLRDALRDIVWMIDTSANIQDIDDCARDAIAEQEKK